LLQVEKTLGVKHNSMVKLGDLPPDAFNVWRVFCDLIANVGVQNITYSEVSAYSSLTGNELMNWEIKALMTIKHSQICKGAKDDTPDS